MCEVPTSCAKSSSGTTVGSRAWPTPSWSRWDGDLARRLSPYVLEVEGADHGMQLPGPLIDTIAVLGRVVAEMEGFLDAIDWPGRSR